MSRRRHTAEQIITALREAEVGLANGKTIAMISREHGAVRWASFDELERMRLAPTDTLFVRHLCAAMALGTSNQDSRRPCELVRMGTNNILSEWARTT